MKIENGGHRKAGFDHIKSEILLEIKRLKYWDLEVMI